MAGIRPPIAGSIRFGVFQLNLHSGELRKHGLKIKLGEQPFQLLQVLVEKPGEVIQRETIQKRIWPSDTFVDFEHGVNNAVMRLREALCDSAENPRYIETIPKRGYRFIGSLDCKSKENMPGESPGEKTFRVSRRFGWGKLVFAGTVVLAIAAVLYASDLGGLRERIFPKAASPVIHSLAVIPLQNLSGDSNQEYFVDGMTDALITELSQINSLRVISRTSAMRYKQTNKPLPQVAKELGVDGIVEGTVQRSGDRVRITAQLIYAPSDQHVWAQSFDRSVADVLSLERNLAVAIAGQIQAKLTAQEKRRLENTRPINPKALEAYLQGEYLSARMSTGPGPEDVKKAIGFYKQAIAEDPDFALAYTGLADIYYVDFLSSKDTVPTQKALLAKALELDPQLARAHSILAWIYLTNDWDLPSAERELNLALELDPNAPFARNRYALYLTVTGRLDEARAQLQRAAELDPLRSSGNGYGTGILPLFRQYDELIAADKRQLEITPNEGFLHWELYRVYAIKGMQPETIDELAKTWSSFGFAGVGSSIEQAYRQSGYTAAIHESIRTLQQLYRSKALFMPAEIARQCTMLGETKKALEWLQIAYEDRDGELLLLKIDPAWDSLQSEPRFQELVRRVGMPG
jgi:TolB-like protein/DNA-binding winged helix-turn-helix (wHTH) protein